MADGKSDDTSLSRRSFGSLAAGTTLAAGTPLVAEAQTAQVVRRWVSDNPAAEVGVVEIVPPGYTTYHLAGSPASPLDPNAPVGSPGRWGDTAQQTDSSLNRIQATLTKLGLTFGDVVKAIVWRVCPEGPTPATSACLPRYHSFVAHKVPSPSWRN
jgi:hypothetical protein